LAHQLYRTLLGPVEEMIRDQKHLIIVADGPLAGFPFHLLIKEAPEAGLEGIEAYKRAHWLIRDHAITVLPAVSSLRALRELAPKTEPAPLPFVGFGDPVIGNGDAVACGSAGKIVVAAVDGATPKGVERGSAGTASEALFRSGSVVDGVPVADVKAVRKLKRLPDTRCELEAIATLQGAGRENLHLDVAATESRVKALSASGQLADYRVVAFSTHGLVTGDAGAAQPALVLTPPDKGTTEDDGLLTASEVATLKLNADWVVLSACNTAAGDGRPDAENLSGLARAFFYAGARSILVSGWPVWSDAAVALTTQAFAALQKDPSLGRAGALRQAMLDTLDAAEDDRQAHPAYWAPFSLVGEGRG
jgi:CHAT domain-containing protein